MPAPAATEALAAYAARLTPRQRAAVEWRRIARPEQLAPPGDWQTSYWRGARGSGKTRACAEWLGAQIADDPSADYGIAAPTLGDVLDSCLQGPSGLFKVLDRLGVGYTWADKTVGHVKLTGGGNIFTGGADHGALRLQGKNLRATWASEIGLWKRTQWAVAWRESVQFSTRMGVARIVADGTPKAGHPLVRLLLDDPTIPKRLMRTRDNAANLSPAWLAKMEGTYAGTRLGRQELEGEDITEVEGALWSPALCEAMRVAERPLHFTRLGVAIDPSGGNKPTNAECGIVVGGLGEDGHVYLLRDLSDRLAPVAWAERGIHAYHEHQADAIIAETNYGGALVAANLAHVDASVPVVEVSASRGKAIRAEPVVTACERGQVHLVGAFPLLEDSLCHWVPGSGDRSPDRLDAFVWLVTWLLADAGAAGASERVASPLDRPQSDRRVFADLV